MNIFYRADKVLQHRWRDCDLVYAQTPIKIVSNSAFSFLKLKLKCISLMNCLESLKKAPIDFNQTKNRNENQCF